MATEEWGAGGEGGGRAREMMCVGGVWVGCPPGGQKWEPKATPNTGKKLAATLGNLKIMKKI